MSLRSSSLLLLAALSPLGALAQQPSAPATPQAPARPTPQEVPDGTRAETLRETLRLAARQSPDVSESRPTNYRQDMQPW